MNIRALLFTLSLFTVSREGDLIMFCTLREYGVTFNISIIFGINLGGYLDELGWISGIIQSDMWYIANIRSFQISYPTFHSLRGR